MVLSPQAEKASVICRETKGGRKLWYRLDVIQQPERARACGSGPKSSADRRPVDPPPVVELRIFEGPTMQNAKDITFTYNANFFLYATLDHARAIAHGRVQTPAANVPPVLTGMPVSGMAYLDRPQEAGYFLFPDLSVRHEGRYRLTFNLYEEVKEDKDMDMEPSETASCLPPEHTQPGASFDWRMDVKSQDFVVYSAKKFTGLAESTGLSRTIAEQGCRVRIRRDVRMRRREGKGSSRAEGPTNTAEYENTEEGYRRRRTETPESERLRARSVSNHSVERTPYSVDSHRRQSGTAMDFPPPPSFGGPQTYASGGHLSFGNQAGSQYPPQAVSHYSQPPSVPPSPSYPGTPYSKGPGYSSQPASYERPPSQHYSAPEPSPKRESFSEYRRPSSSMSSYVSSAMPELADHNKYSMRQDASAQPQAPPTIDSRPDVNLPSFRALEKSIPPLPPVSSPAKDFLDRGPMGLFNHASQPRSMVGSKRKTEHAFGELAPERVQDGRRANNVYEDPDPVYGLYRRADGFEIRRDFFPFA